MYTSLKHWSSIKLRVFLILQLLLNDKSWADIIVLIHFLILVTLHPRILFIWTIDVLIYLVCVLVGIPYSFKLVFTCTIGSPNTIVTSIASSHHRILIIHHHFTIILLYDDILILIYHYLLWSI